MYCQVEIETKSQMHPYTHTDVRCQPVSGHVITTNVMQESHPCHNSDSIGTLLTLLPVPPLLLTRITFCYTFLACVTAVLVVLVPVLALLQHNPHKNMVRPHEDNCKSMTLLQHDARYS